MNSLYSKEEAIPLITFDMKVNKYIVNSGAIELLNEIKGPIGIVAVAGMYRTGKSYLLNRMLLNRSNGFGVGGTVNAHTKGLWLWSKPIIGYTHNNEPVNVLLVDSEGIGAIDESQNHDNKVFALTVLISSMFIYNSVGSIDENAIQNLSLVVNLTKNIHVKANQRVNQNLEDIDSEDYAQHLPNFFWVVRDFTLQLVDTKGESISSREYLEKALALQKGFSDSVEQKNRIRRLLTTFFKERDCITLVRPLTNEENLQNLDKMDFNDLRPEFFEQIISFRKKVLNRVRIKQINNKSLNGQMLVGLIQQYVQAINDGAIPNIENAWTYICKNECYKAMYESLEVYEKNMKEMIHNKLPIGLQDLKQIHQQAKQQSMTVFKKKAMGDDIESFMKEFNGKLKSKYQLIKNENEQEGSRECLSFIQAEFMSIDKKLKNSEYNIYQEYERDVKLFQQFFIENGPQAVNRTIIILEFIQKVLVDGSNYFIRNMSREYEIQQKLGQNEQQRLQTEVQDMKSDQNKKNQMQMLKISQLEGDRQELQTKEGLLKQNVDSLNQEIMRIEQQYRDEQNQDRSKYSKEINGLRNTIQMKEDANKDNDRSNILRYSEFEKERALFTQKIQYLEKTNEELSKKDKEQGNELKNNKKEHIQQNKEIQQKQDQQNKQYQNKVNQLQEKILELENELATKEHNYEMDKKKVHLSENQMNQNIFELNQQVDGLLRENKELKAMEEKYMEMNYMSNRQKEQELIDQVEQMQEELRTKGEKERGMKNDHERENAVLNQRIEFLQMQNNNVNQQLEENKKNYDSMMRLLSSSKQEKSGNQIQELKSKYQMEMQMVQEEYENKCRKLQKELDSINEKYGDLELKYKCDLNEQFNENENIKEQLQQMVKENNHLQENLKNMDNNKLKMVKETETKFSQRIKQLEEQLDEYRNQYQKQSLDYENKNEEQLNQLKNFYDLEKDRLEKKLYEDKQKYERKIQLTISEYEEKQKEEQNNYEEEIENLKDEIADMNHEIGQMNQEFKHELELKDQQIQSQEKYIQEMKENLMNQQQQKEQQMEQQIQKYQMELKYVGEKLDAVNNELNKRDQSNKGLQVQQEQVQNQLQKKEEQYERVKNDLIEERQGLQTKLDEMRDKYQTLNDSFMDQKIQFEKKIALQTQQQQFNQKKIEELNENLMEQQSRYEDRLGYLQKDLQTEQNERISRLEEEKIQISQKYDVLKKELKDKLTDTSRQLGLVEKEKAILEEKIKNVEAKKMDLETRYQRESDKMQTQINTLQQSLKSGQKDIMEQNKKLKQNVQSLESSKQEIQSNYQRDQILWQNKFQFIESQRDQYQKDLQSSKTQFELTLNHLSNKIENDNNENMQEHIQQMREDLEMKFKQKQKEIEDNYQKKILELEDKLKKTEKELKGVEGKLMLENQGKMGNQSLAEKKLGELMEKESKYLEQIEILKNERDQKILEHQDHLEKEKLGLKQKIQMIENKLQESEKKRNNMLFEQEKERTKWNMEKDNLITGKEQLMEELQKVAQKKEQLMLENQKLKSENKQSRKSMYGTTYVQNRGNRFNAVGQSPKRESNIGGINFMSHLNDPNNQCNTSTVDEGQSQKGSEKSFNNEYVSRNNLQINDNQQQFKYQ